MLKNAGLILLAILISCISPAMLLAQKPELLIKAPVYKDAWDDSHFSPLDSPLYQGTIDRSGVAPFTGTCDNPITVAAEMPIIEGLKQFHPVTTVKLSRPLTPGKRYYIDFEASVLPHVIKSHPTTYYNYWPQIFPTTNLERTKIFGNWRYMVTQTHWRTEYGQFLSRKISPGEPITYSEPEPLQMAIWPLEEINYLTFVFTALGENAFMHVPVNDKIEITNIKICSCEEGPVLVYHLGIPSIPENLEELKRHGLTTIKEEVDPSKSCGTVSEAPSVTYVSPVLPVIEKNTQPAKRRKNKQGSLPKATAAQLDREPKKVGRLIKLQSKSAKLGLRDHKLIDGDIVTILVNGHVLVEGYELKKENKWFDLPLLKGDNQITLFAENLGRKVPNTAAITLKSGTIKREVILNSDLKESAFFVIRVK